MTETSADLYVRSFETFLAHTDEKTVFVDEFAGYVHRYGARSVLDIGAGNGDLAVPLAGMVTEYTAVEEKPKYVSKLRDKGLDVIGGSFPVPLDRRYDLVVMSHVISNTAGNYASLIPAAWEAVNDNGHLLIVTHRGDVDHDWTTLLKAVGLHEADRYAASFSMMKDCLMELGDTEMRTVTTSLETDNVTDMLGAMAFVASNGTLDRYERFMAKSAEVTELLESHYRSDAGFSFPFLHIFLSTHKKA